MEENSTVWHEVLLTTPRNNPTNTPPTPQPTPHQLPTNTQTLTVTRSCSSPTSVQTPPPPVCGRSSGVDGNELLEGRRTQRPNSPFNWNLQTEELSKQVCRSTSQGTCLYSVGGGTLGTCSSTALCERERERESERKQSEGRCKHHL